MYTSLSIASPPLSFSNRRGALRSTGLKSVGLPPVVRFGGKNSSSDKIPADIKVHPKELRGWAEQSFQWLQKKLKVDPKGNIPLSRILRDVGILGGIWTWLIGKINKQKAVEKQAEEQKDIRKKELAIQLVETWNTAFTTCAALYWSDWKNRMIRLSLQYPQSISPSLTGKPVAEYEFINSINFKNQQAQGLDKQIGDIQFNTGLLAPILREELKKAQKAMQESSPLSWHLPEKKGEKASLKRAEHINRLNALLKGIEEIHLLFESLPHTMDFYETYHPVPLPDGRYLPILPVSTRARDIQRLENEIEKNRKLLYKEIGIPSTPQDQDDYFKPEDLPELDNYPATWKPERPAGPSPTISRPYSGFRQSVGFPPL